LGASFGFFSVRAEKKRFRGAFFLSIQKVTEKRSLVASRQAENRNVFAGQQITRQTFGGVPPQEK
jgi:hypothetical protein